MHPSEPSGFRLKKLSLISPSSKPLHRSHSSALPFNPSLRPSSSTAASKQAIGTSGPWDRDTERLLFPPLNSEFRLPSCPSAVSEEEGKLLLQDTLQGRQGKDIRTHGTQEEFQLSFGRQVLGCAEGWGWIWGSWLVDISRR